VKTGKVWCGDVVAALALGLEYKLYLA